MIVAFKRRRLSVSFSQSPMAERVEVDYLAKYGIPQLVDKLVCDLLDNKPDDALSFLHAELCRLESRML